METATILSGAAVLISLIGLLMSAKKGTREDAAGAARLEAKLDSISSGVEDIRVETRTTRGRVDALEFNVTVTEPCCSFATRAWVAELS